MISIGILAAILSLIFISISDLISKKISSTIGSQAATTLLMAISLVPLLVVMVYIPPYNISVSTIAYAVIGGLFYAFAILLILKSLETEQASNTWALLNISLISVVLLGAFTLNEPLDAAEVLGIIIVIVGSIMITITEEMGFNKKLIPALVGNILFAGAYLFSTFATAQSSTAYTAVYPISFSVALAMLLILWAFRRKSKWKVAKRLRSGNTLAIAALAGIALGIGQLAWMLAVHLQLVALAAAISDAEPMIIVLMSYLVYKEKLTLLQGVGVMLSLAGALAVSLL